MWKVKILPDLDSVREKVLYGFELWQIFDLLLGLLVSLVTVLLLPDMGMFKGLVCAIPSLPFVIIAFKPFYGLKGLQLLKAVWRSRMNSKPLVFRSEEWRKVNEKL